MVQIFKRACINYIREVRIFFLFYGNEIHTCATVKDHIEDKTFKILCIISHNIYNNRGSPLRIILTFKSNRSMISFGRKHYKYDMHNILSFSCPLGSLVSLWNFETIRGSLMKPK